MLFDLIRLARPKDWVKNAFVVMPVPFALAEGATFEPLPFGLGLAAMCLAGSATYALNDTRDAELDRVHPRKQTRPVASGKISPPVALVFAATLATSALLLAMASGRELAVALVAGYLALNLAYSLGLKHVPLVDVFLLSSGHVVRVFLGCALLSAAASNWLLLCTSTLALFISLTKRRGDVVQGLDPEHRPSLRGYNVAFLDQAMGITAGIALLSYALYTAPPPPGSGCRPRFGCSSRSRGRSRTRSSSSARARCSPGCNAANGSRRAPPRNRTHRASG